MHASSPAPRRLLLWLALASTLLTVVVTSAEAQRRARAAPRNIPADAAVEWTVFVSAFEERDASRSAATHEPGAVDVPIAGWRCTYSAPARAQLNETNWSEVRTLECTTGDAVVSTTGFCQVAGPSWGARAGVLSLGVASAESRVTITLDCAVRE